MHVENENIDWVFSFNMPHFTLDELQTSPDGLGLVDLRRHFLALKQIHDENPGILFSALKIFISFSLSTLLKIFCIQIVKHSKQLLFFTLYVSQIICYTHHFVSTGHG